ncbi:hypothetical protein BOX15_Mlig019032g1 [Macrostomum lignano]|uniref:Uncharacterized protein n=1 Tax=Macrostomum lignano TaxID=282301 RepID=A0A267GUJ7_9PLAT|nr:hypothetical protein BOX15_Mlig019032g1 [Macrostomum lignano]
MSSRDSYLAWLSKPLIEHANKVLSKDLNKSGERLYDHWCRRTRKECFMASYQNEFFRASYCINRLAISARSYIQAADRICADVPEFMDFLRSVRHVISIGCGPGSDAIGLLAFLGCGLPQQQQQQEQEKAELQEQQRIVFYMIDQCDSWADYVSALDAHLVNTGSSLWFKPLRFKDIGHEAYLPPADMIVFSFANTALMDPQLWPQLVRRYRLVLVLDSVRETLKDEYDGCKFNSFQLSDRTRCYFHLAGYSSTNSSKKENLDYSPEAAKVDTEAAMPPPSPMSEPSPTPTTSDAPDVASIAND